MKFFRLLISFCMLGACFTFSEQASTFSLAAPLPAAAGTLAKYSIGYDITKDILSAITQGKVAVGASAKTDGPEDDDQAADDKKDFHDFINVPGLGPITFEKELDATTVLVEGNNKTDDGEEDPYTRGDLHYARSQIHYIQTNAGWKPNGKNCTPCPKNQAVAGFANAAPEDDPTEKNQKTFAAAAAVMTLNGKTAAFCYSAGVSTTSSGEKRFADVKKVTPCPGTSTPRSASMDSNVVIPNQPPSDSADQPGLPFTEAAVFLTTVERFSFEEVGNGMVQISPLFTTPVDLFHTYLQESGNLAIIPTVRGYTPLAQEALMDLYLESVAGTDYHISTSPSQQVSLTIIGAALQFEAVQINRAGKSDLQLLSEYYSSNAVKVVAPQYAQEGYSPRITVLQSVSSGRDISSIIGTDFVVPPNADELNPLEVDPWVGLVVQVEGNLDQAVELALNTQNHFIRDIAATDGADSPLARFDENGNGLIEDAEILAIVESWIMGQLDDATVLRAITLWITQRPLQVRTSQFNNSQAQQDRVEFKVPEMNLHYESPSVFSDIAVASPEEEAEGWNPPIIEGVSFEAMVPINSAAEMTVIFADVDADVVAIDVSNSLTGNYTADLDDIQGRASGTFLLVYSCLDEPTEVVMNIQLIDSHGHRSNIVPIPYSCVADDYPPEPIE